MWSSWHFSTVAVVGAIKIVVVRYILYSHGDISVTLEEERKKAMLNNKEFSHGDSDAIMGHYIYHHIIQKRLKDRLPTYPN